MYLYYILLPIFFFFLSCKSDIQFSMVQDGQAVKAVVVKKTCKFRTKKNICVKKQKELFTIKDLKKDDINFLFVVDVSGSMQENLARLGEGFESLISQIKDSHWRMFFTTADHGDHQYQENIKTSQKLFSNQRWEDYKGTQPYFGQFMNLEYQKFTLQITQLNSTVYDYINVFKDTLTKNAGDDCSLAPYCQGDHEQPLRSLKSSLERLAKETSIKGDIISIIVTDEDERGLDIEHSTSAKEVVSTFKELFPKKTLYNFSLIIKNGDIKCLNKQFSKVYGTRISKLAELTQGTNISICETDYKLPLQDISAFLKKKIENLHLSYIPILNRKIIVNVDGIKLKDSDWSIKHKKIFFTFPLKTGSKIKISYFTEDLIATKDLSPMNLKKKGLKQKLNGKKPKK